MTTKWNWVNRARDKIYVNNMILIRTASTFFFHSNSIVNYIKRQWMLEIEIVFCLGKFVSR